MRFIFVLTILLIFGYLLLNNGNTNKIFGVIHSCNGIYETLNKMETEATSQRIDLEKAYFQLGCNNFLFINNL